MSVLFMRPIIPPEWRGYEIVSYRILWLESGKIEWIEIPRDSRTDFFIREGLKSLAESGEIDSVISMQYYKGTKTLEVKKKLSKSKRW